MLNVKVKDKNNKNKFPYFHQNDPTKYIKKKTLKLITSKKHAYLPTHIN